MRIYFLLTTIFIFVALSGCSVADQSGQLQNAKAAQYAMPATPATGYAGRCAMCHENNGFGVQRMRERLGEDRAILSQRHDLTEDFIRVVVRNGFLAMPPMSKVEVPDKELQQIVSYLTKPVD